MRILIKRLRMSIQGTENVIIQFKSGIEAKLFNYLSFDVKSLIGNEIECLLLANLFATIDSKAYDIEAVHPIMEGIYLGEYSIPEKWKIGKRYELIPDWHNFTYHAIETEDGTFLIRVKPNLEKRNVKVGEPFKFKVINFELMAWEPIEGEREIDPLAFEKNFIKKFWNLMETTRARCKQDANLQLELIRKELLEWTYDEIWLFDNILEVLAIDLKFNKELKEQFKDYSGDFDYFCKGIIALGEDGFKEAYQTPHIFYENLQSGKYAERQEDLETRLYVLIQEVIEEKSGEPLEKIAHFEIREDIDEITERIEDLLKIQLSLK